VLQGIRHEVLRECGRGIRKTIVWLGAFIRNVVNPARSTAPRTASTSYDVMHGCEAADLKVVFISNSVLEALQGGSIHVHHLWNRAGSMGVSPKGGTAFEGLETEKQQLWAADDEEAGRLANRYGCPLVR
jgi:hypothetical protein